MENYFKGETKKIKLSEYLKLKGLNCYLCDEKYRGPRTKYIMEIIGDVELDTDTYKLFLKQFQCSGGRYDVLTKKETIKGIYEISKKYPFLSAAALEEIWFIYIQDLFEEYALDEVIGKYIETYGKTKDAISKYVEYVNELAIDFDKKYVEESLKLEEYSKKYDRDLIKHLQYIIKSQHIPSDQVISVLPSSELIKRDREHLSEICRQTRIYLGACYPISYQMIESLATEEGLDYYPEQPQYVINGERKIDTTFTKQEFLDSIKKEIIKKK